jgi:hypothetical protein
LKNNTACYHEQIPDSLLSILKRLADGGFMKNNRQWIVCCGWSRGPWLFQVIRSMNNLEKLSLLECKLKLTDVQQLFRSCPKLVELHLMLLENDKLEMNEGLKDDLRSGFQRIRLFDLENCIESWPTILEILT